MIPRVEEFFIVTEVKDALGKITSTSEKSHWGVIDDNTQFAMVNGSADVIGKGLIFTDETITLTEGQRLKINSEEYYAKRIYRGTVLGVFHHYEITYA